MSSAAGDAHRSEGTPLERMTGAIGITPGQPHGQSSNPEPNLRRPTEEEEWNRAVEKSRISAEAEAARRAQQEEQELAEALAASQGTNGQTLSDAERYAQEEKELREALEASNRESDDLQRALRDSMNLTEGPVASGSGTKSQSQSNYQISEIRTPLAVSTDLPPTSSVHHVPSPSPSRHSSVVSTSTSPSMSPNPARRSSRPLPRPPNGNLTQQLLSNSSPTSSSINQRVSSATSFAPPSLFNPFDDGASLYQTQPDATLSSSLSQPLFSGGTIPYHRPGSSQDQGRPEILHRDSESVSPRSSWAHHSNTSLSTLEHSATRSSTDLGHDVDQQLLKDEEQVNAVYIGFPRLAPLASGTVCPQVIQVVEEAGLQTFSIEAKSYRTLITYLHWWDLCLIFCVDRPRLT